MRVTYPPPTPTAGGLEAANNLSDVASAASARDNLEVLSETDTRQRLAARAPRDWLSLDGTTAGAIVHASLGTIGNVGLSDFTLLFGAYVPTAAEGSIGTHWALLSSGFSGYASPTANGPTCPVHLIATSASQVSIKIGGDGGVNSLSYDLRGNHGGRFVWMGLTRSIANNRLRLWVAAGVRIDWGGNGTTLRADGEFGLSWLRLGAAFSGAPNPGGFRTAPILINREWQQADFDWLEATGDVPAQDTGTGSVEALLTGDDSTFDTDTGYYTKLGGCAISAGQATGFVGGASNAIFRDYFLRAGRTYRITLTGTTSEAWRLGWASFSNIYVGSKVGADPQFQSNGDGTHTLLFTVSPVATTAVQTRLGIFNGAGSGSFQIDTLTAEEVGTVARFDVGRTAYLRGRHNGINGFLTPGVTPLPSRRPDVETQEYVVGATGFVGADQPLFFDPHLVREVWVRAETNTPAITLRRGSSGGTIIVNAQATTLDTWVLAAVVEGSRQGAARDKLHATLSTAGSVRVLILTIPR